MKKISLFIAMSLDGYIADSKGSVEWLTGQGNDDDNIDAYSEFVKDIDTVIMGWNTYHQIVTELSPDEWVYDDFTTYVVTHKPKTSSDKIRFVNENTWPNHSNTEWHFCINKKSIYLFSVIIYLNFFKFF